MNRTKKIFIALIFTLGLLVGPSTPAFALDLDSAKAQGLVGEDESGYLAAVSPPNSEVQQLIQRINTERKEHYAQIAKQHNTAVGAVEALAAKKAIELTPPGQYVRESGRWKKK